MTKHTWMEVETGVQCIWCGASFRMTPAEYDQVMPDEFEGVALRKGVAATCEEERVRQVMES